MIGIYKFTNLTNNKNYIGQSINIELRYYQHSVNYLNQNHKEYNTYFYKALRKYGFNNFNFTILEETTKENLDDREKYWIKYYDSNNQEKGYNLTSGGSKNNTTSKLKKVYQFDLNGNFIRAYKSSKEAAEIIFNDISFFHGITACAQGKVSKTFHNYIFTYDDTLSKEELNRRTSCKTSRQVKCVSKDGTIERTFKTIKEASRTFNISPTNITKVLNGERKTAGGFYWYEI